MTHTQQATTDLRQVAPGDLVIGTNVRLDPRIAKDRAFKASIKDLGVLTPIVATEARTVR